MYNDLSFTVKHNTVIATGPCGTVALWETKESTVDQDECRKALIDTLAYEEAEYSEALEEGDYNHCDHLSEYGIQNEINGVLY